MKLALSIFLTLCLNAFAATTLVPIPYSQEPRATVLSTNDDLIVNATNANTGTWTTKRATVGTLQTAILPAVSNLVSALVSNAPAGLDTNAIQNAILNAPLLAPWNLQTNQLAAPINIIFEGDSLTQEVGAGTDNPHTPGYFSYPFFLRSTWTNSLGSWTNVGHGGDNLYNVTNRLATVLAAKSASNNLMILWIGANDFVPTVNAITNAASWISTWQRYCSNIQSAGFKLAVCTVQDRNGYESDITKETFRATINAAIRTNKFKDFLIDFDYANPSMNPTNNWRTFDGTHASTNGAAWQAQFVDWSIRWQAWANGTIPLATTTPTNYVTSTKFVGSELWNFTNGALASVVTPPTNSVLTNLVASFMGQSATCASGTATNWLDSSGNGNNATNALAYQPLLYNNVLNGYPAYLFTNGAYLRTPYSTTISNIAVFAVYNSSSSAGVKYLLDLNGWNALCVNDASALMWFLNSAACTLSVSSGWVCGGGSRSGTNFYTFGPNGTTNACTSSFSSTFTGQITLGGATVDGTYNFVGYVAELNVYTNLSYPDCLREITYLRSKYGSQ